MSTMKEMAESYRAESARIAMRIREKQDAGAAGWEIEELRRMLREMRAKQRTLETYYDAPREISITMSCARAPKYKREDDS